MDFEKHSTCQEAIRFPTIVCCSFWYFWLLTRTFITYYKQLLLHVYWTKQINQNKKCVKRYIATGRDTTCLKTNRSPHKLSLPLPSMLARPQPSRDLNRPIRGQHATDQPMGNKQSRGLTGERWGVARCTGVLVSRLLIWWDQSRSGW